MKTQNNSSIVKSVLDSLPQPKHAVKAKAPSKPAIAPKVATAPTAPTAKKNSAKVKPAVKAPTVLKTLDKCVMTAYSSERVTDGQLSRLGKAETLSDGTIRFTPCQNDKGLTLTGADSIIIQKDGAMSGSFDARLCAGGYVSGGKAGGRSPAKCVVRTLASVKSSMKPCLVKWKCDDSKPVAGLYAGNPTQSGYIVSVIVSNLKGDYVWHIEAGKNPKNEFCFGKIESADGKPLAIVK